MYKNTEREEANAKCYRRFCNNVKSELRKRDCCPNCGKDIHVKSEEVKL